MSEVRVRFAPSPTGLLHIGSARSALFNWLYARHTGGRMILRIEDTDAARNTPQALAAIFDGLRWLGIDWDEGPEVGGPHGPYFQSQRNDQYQTYVERLLSSGQAYEDDGAVRFKTPKTPCTVPDLVCGDVVFDRTTDPDLVIRRANGSPVFHLVNVVDDIEMQVTHVIRGEDHLSNTPKHLALFEAFGAKRPHYAHIPLILNTNGSKMSKRDQGASVGEYVEHGYIPEAVVNYLCLLGWSPKDNREVFPISEVIERFDLPQINRSNARFDLDKMYWVNSQYVRQMPIARFRELSKPILKRHNVIDDTVTDAYLEAVLELVKEKVRFGDDLPEWTRFFFTEDFPVDEKAHAKRLGTPEARARLSQLVEAFAAVPDWTSAALEEALKGVAERSGVKVGELVHPCRVAVSGTGVGPSLYHMLEVLGRDRVLARMRKEAELGG